MEIYKRKPRIIKSGYRIIYKPDHPTAMKSSSYIGYIYEHIYIIEKDLGRSLTENEIVHHLDNNPANNRIDNLLVLDKSQHSKIHAWINKYKSTNTIESIFNFKKSDIKNFKPIICKVCEITLQKHQEYCCSPECILIYNDVKRIENNKLPKPSKDQLQEDMNKLPWTEIGKKYGVSNNAAKKWVKGYELDIENKPHIICNKNYNPNKKYNTPEEKQKAKNERSRIKYSTMTDNEKKLKRKNNYLKYGY